MNRRAFLKWLSAASTVVLVAPSLIITPTVEPVPLTGREVYAFWLTVVGPGHEERTVMDYGSTYR